MLDLANCRQVLLLFVVLLLLLHLLLFVLFCLLVQLFPLWEVLWSARVVAMFCGLALARGGKPPGRPERVLAALFGILA